MFEQKVVIKQALKLNRFKELQTQLKESRVSILNSEGVGYGEVTEVIFLPKKLEVRVKVVNKTLDLSKHTFVCVNGVWSLTGQ